jgi:hypothetical protein
MNFSASELGISETGKDGRPRVSIGKGDSPRNCQSDAFRENYDTIDWGRNHHGNQEKRNSKKGN